MNKTEFKNSFNKYFQQIKDAHITAIRSNNVDTMEIDYSKNNRKNKLQIQSSITISKEQVLDFSFILNKIKMPSDLPEVLQKVETIHEISLFVAQDAFCKEQALEFTYNTNKHFYVLIYTNMVENSLEFFEGKLMAEKFKKVAF